jgi:hypothetical protein
VERGRIAARRRFSEPAVVVLRAYDLALWIVRKVEKFPRSFRFSIGERLIARSLDVLETLVEAASASDKRNLLEPAAGRGRSHHEGLSAFIGVHRRTSSSTSSRPDKIN